MKITIERCRSHEVSSSPQAWEVVETHEDFRQAAESVERLISPRGASGDQYRVIEDGAEYDPIGYLMLTYSN